MTTEVGTCQPYINNIEENVLNDSIHLKMNIRITTLITALKKDDDDDVEHKKCI